MIYFSIFCPYISYGCSIWASNFVTCFKRVQKLQNRAVKLLPEFYNSDEIPAHEYFKIRDYKIAIFSYKYLNRLFTPAFENCFTFNKDRHDHNTRKADNLLMRLGVPLRHLCDLALLSLFGIYCPSV